MELLWLVLTGFFFAAAGGPADWSQWEGQEWAAWAMKIGLNIAAVFFLNLYLGEALR